MKVKFKCPGCGGTDGIEEVMVDVTVSSIINEVHECGDAEYGCQTNDGGEVDRFQCLQCGLTVGSELTEYTELFTWLKNNGMIEEDEGYLCDCGVEGCTSEHLPQGGDSCGGGHCAGVLIEDGDRVFCELCGWRPGD